MVHLGTFEYRTDLQLAWLFRKILGMQSFSFVEFGCWDSERECAARRGGMRRMHLQMENTTWRDKIELREICRCVRADTHTLDSRAGAGFHLSRKRIKNGETLQIKTLPHPVLGFLHVL